MNFLSSIGYYLDSNLSIFSDTPPLFSYIINNYNITHSPMLLNLFLGSLVLALIVIALLHRRAGKFRTQK